MPALLATLASDVELVSPISGRMCFSGIDDVGFLLGKVYGLMRELRWSSVVSDGAKSVLIGEGRVCGLRVTDAMVLDVAPDGRIMRIGPHLRPWLALTVFAAVLGPKVAIRPGVVLRALKTP